MAAEQHLVAASEVKRSGTRALSGFMRAERDTLRMGGRPVVPACFQSGGKFCIGGYF